jgi:hypothetical protein
MTLTQNFDVIQIYLELPLNLTVFLFDLVPVSKFRISHSSIAEDLSTLEC